MNVRLLVGLAPLVLVACQASVGAQVGAGVGGGDEEGETVSGPADPDRTIAAGDLPSLSCNHGHVRLAPGTYHGDLVVSGNHCVVEGAGVDQTVVDGNLSLDGNHNVVRGVTVNGNGKVSGNHNVARSVHVKGTVEATGNHSAIEP